MRIVYFIMILLIGLTTSCEKPEPIGPNREINQKHIEKRNSEKVYDYNKEVKRTQSPYIRTLMQWLSEVGEFLGTTTGIIIIIVFFALVVIYFIQVKGGKKLKEDHFQSSNKSLVIEDLDKLKDLPLASLEEKVLAALNDKDYRAAIRYSFVLILLTLNEKEALKYHLEKTNLDYQREVPKELRKDFRVLCFIYDYVWYGSYETNLTIWNQFSSTKSKLLSHE